MRKGDREGYLLRGQVMNCLPITREHFVKNIGALGFKIGKDGGIKHAFVSTGRSDGKRVYTCEAFYFQYTNGSWHKSLEINSKSQWNGFRVYRNDKGKRYIFGMPFSFLYASKTGDWDSLELPGSRKLIS